MASFHIQQSANGGALGPRLRYGRACVAMLGMTGVGVRRSERQADRGIAMKTLKILVALTSFTLAACSDPASDHSDPAPDQQADAAVDSPSLAPLTASPDQPAGGRGGLESAPASEDASSTEALRFVGETDEDLYFNAVTPPVRRADRAAIVSYRIPYTPGRTRSNFVYRYVRTEVEADCTLGAIRITRFDFMDAKGLSVRTSIPPSPVFEPAEPGTINELDFQYACHGLRGAAGRQPVFASPAEAIEFVDQRPTQR
jgi:hypothetical protein